MQYRATKFLSVTVAMALLATISACGEPTISRDSDSRSRFELAPDGDRALYKSGDELTSEADRRAEMPTAELVKLEETQGYQSLRDYLDGKEWSLEAAQAGEGSEEPTGNEAEALKNDGVTRSDFNVADGILSLLNTRGEIQVGDSVYKLTRDYAYAVQVNDLPLLREKVPTLSSPAPTDGDPRIVVEPVETTEMPGGEKPAANRSPGARFSLGSVSSSCYITNGNRMHGKSYITNAWFYSEAGIRTSWERKKYFLFVPYWSETATSGTLGYYYSLSGLTIGGSSVYPTSGSGSASGVSSVGRTIISGWFRSIRGTIYGTHWSPLGTCYTAVSM
ncbi:MAG TPA: hypothetical protein VF771_01515 [Longimicrobiaceae bacterium]